MRILLYKISVGFLLLLAVAYGQAQPQFAYKTPVTQVRETKFYSIPLIPQLLASCKRADLADIRITDSAGSTVPYIIRSDLPVLTSGSFAPYPILGIIRKDSSTEVTIRNESAGAINSLLLIIKNASATRPATLSGSDDSKNWFVIDERILLEQTASTTGDRFVQAISFPLSNYRFFKIIIHDQGLLPLNILQAGVYKNLSSSGKYFPVPVRSFTRNDSSDHYSYLIVRFSHPYKTDKISLTVRRPALYRRSFEVYINKPVQYTPIEDGELRPQDNTIMLSAKTNELLVKIYNADNPPLVIDSVLAYQASQQLVAQLEKDTPYYILTGNEEAGKPDYDLQFFTDSISSRLATISTGTVTKNTTGTVAAKPDSSRGKLILWIIIGTVLLLLLVLTVRMSKEVGRKQE